MLAAQMYLQPIKHKILALLGLSRRDLSSIAIKQWTIAPASRQAVQPSIYIESHLERVTGTAVETSVAHEMAVLRNNFQEHRATTAFLLEAVDVVDGYLYCGRWKDRLLPVNAPLWASKPVDEIKSGSLACTFVGNSRFGHWLIDDLALHLAAESLGEPFVVERQAYSHEEEYRQLLDIRQRKVSRTRLHQMVIIDDIGQNPHKRERYDLLRSRLASNVCATERRSGYIFIRRGVTGQSRSLVNEAEVEAYLISQGFAVVDPEQMSPTEIAQRTLEARLVVSVEGSHIAHVMYTMAEGGVVCCIQPPTRFVNIFRGYGACLNFRYAVLVGHMNDQGFRVSLDDLKAILDRIAAVQ
jgi:Glycosyltransferase 61